MKEGEITHRRCACVWGCPQAIMNMGMEKRSAGKEEAGQLRVLTSGIRSQDGHTCPFVGDPAAGRYALNIDCRNKKSRSRYILLIVCRHPIVCDMSFSIQHGSPHKNIPIKKDSKGNKKNMLLPTYQVLNTVKCCAFLGFLWVWNVPWESSASIWNVQWDVNVRSMGCPTQQQRSRGLSCMIIGDL